MPLDISAWHADLISITAHKIYGPKGVGALVLRADPRLKLLPLLHGGNQERHLRAGTLAPHQVLGFAVAAELAVQELSANLDHISALNRQLLAGLATLPGVSVHGAAAKRVPHIVNIGVAGVDGGLLSARLNEWLAVSNGSACNVNTKQPSHVLLAQGVPLALARASVRFSLGKMTTPAEVSDTIGYLTTLLNMAA